MTKTSDAAESSVWEATPKRLPTRIQARFSADALCVQLAIITSV